MRWQKDQIFLVNNLHKHSDRYIKSTLLHPVNLVFSNLNYVAMLMLRIRPEA